LTLDFYLRGAQHSTTAVALHSQFLSSEL